MASVEKKYLVDNEKVKHIDFTPINRVKISQFYTKIKVCKEVRYQKIDKKYYKSIKTGSQIRKKLENKKISKKEFLKAKDKRVGNIIKKTRYRFKISNKKYVIDRYKKELKGLSILEVKFSTIQKADNFKIPNELKKYIKLDVSKNSRYRDKNLALLGNPKKIDYDLYSIFKEIENKNISNLDNIIFKEMPVDDAIRILLFKIYNQLKIDRETLIKQKDIQALSRFRENIKKSRIILNEFKYLFEKNIYKKLYQNLSIIQKSIYIDKEINILKYNMNLLEAIFDEKELINFLKELDEKIEDKKEKVIKFLQTREFNIIFNQYNLLIKESHYINKKSYDELSIYKLVKKVIKKNHKKSKKLINRYEKCYDLDSYKKIYLSIYKLSILLDEFKYFFKQKNYKQLNKELNRVKESLIKYIDTSRESIIIKTYIKESNQPIQIQNRVIQKVKKERKDIQIKLDTIIEKEFKNFNNIKLNINS